MREFQQISNIISKLNIYMREEKKQKTQAWLLFFLNGIMHATYKYIYF